MKIKVHKYKKVSKLARREAAKAYLFLCPSLIGVSIFFTIPFLDAVRRSFLDAMGRKYVGFQNYITVLHNRAFILAVKNTMHFLGVCIPILLILSLLLATIVKKQTKFQNFFKTTFLIPMAIPVAAVVLLWKLMLHKNGLVNSFLLFFGGNAIDFMNSDYAFYVLIFSYLWKNTGYDMILWLAGLGGIPDALYEAAALDGAGKWQAFRYITIPELQPTFFMISVLSLVNSFKVFREAYLIAGNYPEDGIYMIQHLFNNWFVNLDIQKMCAAAVLFVLAILLFVLVIGYITNKEEGQK